MKAYPYCLTFFTMALATTWGCVFDVSGVPIDNGDAGLPGDARPDVDAPPSFCMPDQPYCEGNVLQTCDSAGDGPVAGMEVTCDFICAADACVYASNMPATIYEACDSTAPALEPPAGATLTFTKLAAVARLTCDPHCGDGSTTSIDAIDEATGPDRAWFCFSTMAIPGDVNVNYSTTLGEAVIVLVDGDVDIAGTIDFRGGNNVEGLQLEGGPGGGDGGSLSGSAGNNGQGDCPGLGGAQVGSANDFAGGGGGGGGFGGAGGAGGTGRNPDADVEAAGGEGGADSCALPALIPLRGGSGGGSGGDGTCGGNCGWPGGAGGGAIEIASRTAITISGSINTSGGNGYGESTGAGAGGGAGGGGAGGAILLESRDITVTGMLIANGGNGGTGEGGPGGAGASGANASGAMGASYGGAQQGGSGGGGGGGHIRMNTPGNAAQCNGFASPAPLCTSGDLSATAP